MRLLAALFAIASLPVAEGAAVSRDWNAKSRRSFRSIPPPDPMLLETAHSDYVRLTRALSMLPGSSMAIRTSRAGTLASGCSVLVSTGDMVDKILRALACVLALYQTLRAQARQAVGWRRQPGPLW